MYTMPMLITYCNAKVKLLYKRYCVKRRFSTDSQQTYHAYTQTQTNFNDEVEELKTRKKSITTGDNLVRKPTLAKGITEFLKTKCLRLILQLCKLFDFIGSWKTINV